MTRLVFILSLPRAGSTLLQRLLMADGKCASVGEPSLLLRFLGDDEVIQRRATYGEGLMRMAIDDLKSACPDYDEVYRQAVRKMAMDIYQRLAGDKPWFLDKTPRYHLIAEELIRTFPDARFIVLWRHPLAVAASMASTFRRGRWDMEEFGIDLYAGMERLIDFTEQHKDAVCQIRYEDLVSKPEESLKQAGDYLGWENLERVLAHDLPTDNKGRLGDPTGVRKYSSVSTESRDSWIAAYDNWYRRSWATRYFCGARAEAFHALGYDFPEELRSGNIRPLRGLCEWLGAAKRLRRRTTHPVEPGRSNRGFHKKHGYHITHS